MKKVLFIIVLALNLCWGSGTEVQAQGYFNFGYGLGLNLTSYDGVIKSGYVNSNEQIILSGKFTKVNVVYVPRYQFLQLRDDFGLGVASYIELGMSFYTVNQTGKNAINDDWDNSRTGFQFGIPLLVEAAYGAGATEDSNQPFGLFVGGGLDIQYNITKDSDGIPGFVYGPTLGGGIRFGISDNNYVSIRTAYSIPMVDHWKNQFTVQVLLHFY